MQYVFSPICIINGGTIIFISFLITIHTEVDQVYEGLYKIYSLLYGFTIKQTEFAFNPFHTA